MSIAVDLTVNLVSYLVRGWYKPFPRKIDRWLSPDCSDAAVFWTAVCGGSG
jgi:hypothetical protein